MYSRWVVASVCGPFTLKEYKMAKAKTPRTAKPKAEKKILQMPDNGKARNGYAPAGLEPEIRIRAYETYEQRGCTSGHEAEDWLAAELEGLARQTQHTHTRGRASGTRCP